MWLQHSRHVACGRRLCFRTRALIAWQAYLTCGRVILPITAGGPHWEQVSQHSDLQSCAGTGYTSGTDTCGSVGKCCHELYVQHAVLISGGLTILFMDTHARVRSPHKKMCAGVL
jgi:hypothetical protein